MLIFFGKTCSQRDSSRIKGRESFLLQLSHLDSPRAKFRICKERRGKIILAEFVKHVRKKETSSCARATVRGGGKFCANVAGLVPDLDLGTGLQEDPDHLSATEPRPWNCCSPARDQTHSLSLDLSQINFRTQLSPVARNIC